MDRERYVQLLAALTPLPLSAWPHCGALAARFGVSVDTVRSIYSLEVQARVLRSNHVVKSGIGAHARRWLAGKSRGRRRALRRLRPIAGSSPDRRTGCAACRRQLPLLRRRCSLPLVAACAAHSPNHSVHPAGADAVQLAFELEFSPCVLLRRLLEALQLGLARERITRVLRFPAQLPSLVDADGLAAVAGAAIEAAAEAAGAAGAQDDSSSRGGLSGGGASSTQLEAAAAALLARLQRDVEACVLCDRCYSPASGTHGMGSMQQSTPMASRRCAAARDAGASMQGLQLCRFPLTLPACHRARPCCVHADAARHAAGNAYEERLNAALAAAGVAFWTEVRRGWFGVKLACHASASTRACSRCQLTRAPASASRGAGVTCRLACCAPVQDQLRSRGYHKTPDARLQVAGLPCGICTRTWRGLQTGTHFRCSCRAAQPRQPPTASCVCSPLASRQRCVCAALPPAARLAGVTRAVCPCVPPDLQVPIAVQGHIVNWIDSKATFGDDKLHRSGAGPGARVRGLAAPCGLMVAGRSVPAEGPVRGGQQAASMRQQHLACSCKQRAVRLADPILPQEPVEAKHGGGT